MAKYLLNERAVDKARRLIENRQYVLTSDWGERQPRAEDENRFLPGYRKFVVSTTSKSEP